MDRRRFLKCAGAAGLVVAGSAFVGSQLRREPSVTSVQRATEQSATSQSTTLPSLNARFSYRTDLRTLRYIVPNSAEEIQFVNETEVSPSSLPVDYEWSIDGNLVAKSRDCSCRLQETRRSGNPHNVRLAARSGLTTSSARQNIAVDEEAIVEYPESRLQIPVKGLNFRSSGSWGWFPSEDETKECMWVTRNELGCNSVLIDGADDQKLLGCAEIALKEGIETILLSPRRKREDYTMNEHTSRIIEFSKTAEEFREKCPGAILIVGNELTLDVVGVLGSATYDERALEWDAKGYKYDKELDQYLKTIVEGVRKNFNGKIAYASAVAEARYLPYDELELDILCPHMYHQEWPDGWNDEWVLDVLSALRRNYGKPIYVSEFGCATFTGAPAGEYAGQPYDQAEQAKNIISSLKLFHEAKVDGVFLYTLFWPNVDDAWSYGILKYSGKKNAEGEEDPSVRLERKLGFYAYKSYKRSA